MPEKSMEFDRRPFLILCEGESDKRFLDNLIKYRQIANDFQVRFPSRWDDNGGDKGGKSKFGKWLDTTSRLASFKRNIEAIIVISDNDDSHEVALQELMTNLQLANEFTISTKNKNIARGKNAPPLAIFMIPEDRPGNLETLCLKPAFAKWPLEADLRRFLTATPAREWSIGKQSKMMIQCLIAANCKRCPDIGFLGHWRLPNEDQLPLGDNAFDEIEKYLRNFNDLVTGA